MFLIFFVILFTGHLWSGLILSKIYTNYNFADKPCEWIVDNLPLWITGDGLLRDNNCAKLICRDIGEREKRLSFYLKEYAIYKEAVSDPQRFTYWLRYTEEEEYWNEIKKWDESEGFTFFPYLEKNNFFFFAETKYKLHDPTEFNWGEWLMSYLRGDKAGYEYHKKVDEVLQIKKQKYRENIISKINNEFDFYVRYASGRTINISISDPKFIIDDKLVKIPSEKLRWIRGGMFLKTWDKAMLYNVGARSVSHPAENPGFLKRVFGAKKTESGSARLKRITKKLSESAVGGKTVSAYLFYPENKQINLQGSDESRNTVFGVMTSKRQNRKIKEWKYFVIWEKSSGFIKVNPDQRGLIKFTYTDPNLNEELLIKKINFTIVK